MATKNLGQASAIISKSTAPTNTKVIWRDTSVNPVEYKSWNGTDWVKIKIDFFTDLEDTPNTYTNQAGKVLIVNQTEDGLEFSIQTGGVEEAPNDGQQYVRQSEGWAVITPYTDAQAEALNPTQLGAFSSVVDFTKNTTIRHTVAGAIEFTLGANPVLGKKAIFYLVADGLNAPTFDVEFVEKFNNYDNTLNKVNRIYMEYVGNNTVIYEVTYV